MIFDDIVFDHFINIEEINKINKYIFLFFVITMLRHINISFHNNATTEMEYRITNKYDVNNNNATRLLRQF